MTSREDIAATFRAAERDPLSIERAEAVARALFGWDDLDSAIGAQTPHPLHGDLIAYRCAIAEAANPAARAERMLVEAAERERWAKSGRAEETYRLGCVTGRTSRNDLDGAAEDQRLADLAAMSALLFEGKANALRDRAAVLMATGLAKPRKAA